MRMSLSDALITLAQTTPTPPDDSGALAWWVVGLLSLAAAMVALELFVPSGGLIAVVAGLCALGGVVLAFKISILTGTIALGLVVVLTPTILWMAFKVFPSTPVGRHIILTEGTTEEDIQRRQYERHAEAEAISSLIGAEAKALTGLRPGGTIRLDGEDIEAFAETGIIPAGTRVVVTSVNGRQIRVMPADEVDNRSRPT
jgi:membrane-bound serine protease (ClpP class)